MNESKSYLELVIGPMFSGKTSFLINIYKKFNFCDLNVLTINHTIDNRYSLTQLCTHDLIEIPCKFLNKISDVFDLPEYNASNVILINEGQFFEDLEEGVKRFLNENKKVYVAGLDSDYQQKKFGQILDLIPLCDKIIKLHSLCALCKNGEEAIFSKRLSDEKQQTLVGNKNYIPVCRKCFYK